MRRPHVAQNDLARRASSRPRPLSISAIATATPSASKTAASAGSISTAAILLPGAQVTVCCYVPTWYHCGVRWADFEQAAPELAALGRERIEQFGFVFVGTIRRDGGPRVNPAEAHFVRGELALTLLPRSLKALALVRDPRAFVHTPILERLLGTPGEFKLRARALPIADPALRCAVADTVERASGWRPGDDWRFFTLDVESASFHRYDENAETHLALRWTPERGVETETKAALG
jgi:hypothetical protein